LTNFSFFSRIEAMKRDGVKIWKRLLEVVFGKTAWCEFDYIVFGFLKKRNHQKTKCLLKFDKDWKQIENRL
jgi:hypothetical protein